MNNDRKHILTGNLQIIKNNKLRKLFSKGPKYREINFKTARETIKSGIEDFIKSLSETKKKGIFNDSSIGIVNRRRTTLSQYGHQMKEGMNCLTINILDSKNA